MARGAAACRVHSPMHWNTQATPAACHYATCIMTYMTPRFFSSTACLESSIDWTFSISRILAIPR